ncbi:DUF7213 family protein [Rhodococcus qingshengii]|uniref:DUF7213 family protein n=1 Tax=Rhodococcus TaxID=1827 RepID=UPI001BA64484|nr:hypothetical protein [Rhodococcus qingshengii]MBS3692602.1 hypothetical protein [Rhodococcus qingshengii]
MSERLTRAYEQLDAAINELTTAADEAEGTRESWIVSHYALVVGQQRFTDEGTVDSTQYLALPFGGPLTYSIKGLLSEIPELIGQTEEADLE